MSSNSFRRHWWIAFTIVSLWTACTPDCPDDSIRLGRVCRRLPDAGYEEADAAPATSSEVDADIQLMDAGLDAAGELTHSSHPDDAGCDGADSCDCDTTKLGESCREAIWSAPRTLEHGGEQSASHLRIAISDGGYATLAWLASDNETTGHVWSNRYRPGQGWETSVSLAAFASDPRVATSPNGAAKVFWTVPPAEVWESSAESGSWMPAVRVNPDGMPGLMATPAFIDDDLAIALWTGTFASSQRRGGLWVKPTQIGGSNFKYEVQPFSIAISEHRAVVAWRVNDAQAIRTTRFEGGSWQAEPARPQSTGIVTSVEAAANASSSLLIWSTETGVRSRLSLGSSDWGEQEVVSNTGKEPQAGLDQSNRAIAIWRNADGAGRIVASTRIDGAWQAPVAVSNQVISIDSHQLAMNSAGKAHAVWSQADGVTTSVWTSRHSWGDGWSKPTRLSDQGARGAKEPRIAINASGTCIAAWLEQDGSRYKVRSATFE